MKIKRIVAAAMAGITVVSMASGCGEKKADDGRMKITWMGYPVTSTSKQDSYPEKLIEEKFDVDIEPIFLDSEGYTTKKPLMLSSGDIPDVVYETDPQYVQSNVNQGFYMELDYDTIKENAPTVFNIINEMCPEEWTFSNVNGKNYGVPNTTLGENPRLGMWRKDWMEKVGVDKIPETIDEMYTLLKKFRDEDPDGNGKQDTYGMSGDLKAQYTTFGEIFGAYGVLPFGWNERDGKLVYGAKLPETKQVLELLAKWYSEGLIHPDFITDDVYKTGKDKFTNGVVGYINNGGGFGCMDETNPNSQIGIMKAINPSAEIVMANYPTGPEGKSGIHVWGNSGHIVCFGKQLKDEPEKVKKILEIMEAMVTDDDFSLKLRCGEEGVHWEKIEPAENVGSLIKQLPPYNDRKQSDNECFRTYLYGTSQFALVPASLELYEEYRTDYVRDFENTYTNPKYGIKDPLLKVDAVPSASKYYGDLKNKQLTYFAEIIRGEKPVSAFDEFIELWDANGGAVLEEEAQQMAQLKEDIYAQVGLNSDGTKPE